MVGSASRATFDSKVRRVVFAVRMQSGGIGGNMRLRNAETSDHSVRGLAEERRIGADPDCPTQPLDTLPKCLSSRVEYGPS